MFGSLLRIWGILFPSRTVGGGMQIKLCDRQYTIEEAFYMRVCGLKMAAANMAKEGFQTQFASVMEKVLKTAVMETTQLFETTIEELRCEIFRINEENEDLKSRIRTPENAKKSTGESETAEPGPSQRTTSHIGKRDIGVQCVLTVQALPRSAEQHLREEDQWTELHRGAYDKEDNPQMAFVLIKQEVDWEADYSDDYSPGYILLKQEGGEPPTLVRRQPLRELPGRALVPPGAVRALVNRYTQERPPTTQSTSAEAPLQGDPDTQEVPQALSPSQPRTREVTSGSAGQDPGGKQKSLVIPAAEPPSTLHQTASPQSAATIQSTSTVLSTVMAQSTVTSLSKETVQTTTAVQSTVPVKSTAALSERPPPVLSGLPRTRLQDTQPSSVPLRPPRSQSHTDVLPVARPISVPSTQPARPTAVPDGPPAAPPTQPQPPTVLEKTGVATATPPTPVQSAQLLTLSEEVAGPPEKQVSLVTEHVQPSPTLPSPKSPVVPERTSDEAPVQLSAPAVTTPSGCCQMFNTQFLAQLSVAPLVRSPPRVEEKEEEEDEGERLSPLPATSTEAVMTRSVATETTPVGEKKEEIVVQVGGGRKSSRRESILSGLRLRLRPRPQDSTPSPVVAKKPRGERTTPLDHDYSKVMQNRGEKYRESHVDQDVVEDTANGETDDDKSSGQGSSNHIISEEEGGANTDVTSLTRQSPIVGVSKSKKRSMTWVQAQRGLALAQAKRSRSKVTKTSQRGQRSELIGLVTQTPFLPSTPQRRRSYSPSPHAASTSSLSPRRTSPRCTSPHGAPSPHQATGANVNPSPATPPHPQPHQFKVISASPRRGRPRSAAAAVLNLKRSPSTPQPIPFIVTVSPHSGFKKSPPCTLTFQQAQRYRKSQAMWSPPGPFQLQQSPKSPRKRFTKNQCADCGRVLSSAAALESHASLHTGKRPFACSTCGKDFPNLKGLNRHARVHGEQRGHQCLKCDKTFVYRFGLTKHEQMVHSGVRPFICPICDKRFVIRRDMETHLRVHTGEKPFACSLCVKRFKRRVELNVHLRWHNGEKRHWCSYCGKGFLDYNNLKRHKFVHTGEKPYTCTECGKHFKQTGHLKKHLKTIHKDR
ncbi:zinc finger protein 777-like [Salvelinus fontinalis]|uniref:zinc finger protein 777-like n=1 Tax=Salvelinus fontinalis TaxID=8038 RepID=UPI002486875D|nr:zinc finger protein 777-like [Salvelinus fontinalis]